MSTFTPWQVLHLELGEPLPELSVSPGYQGLYVIVWRAGIPLGHLEIQAAQLPLPPSQLMNLIAHEVAPAVGCHLLEQGFQGGLPVVRHNPLRDVPPNLDAVLTLEKPLALLEALPTPSATESVSVVVCTRDRPELLQACLRSLQQLDPAPLEIIVVDNAPTSEATYQLVSQLPDVRYVKEPRPGLSAARNRGIRESKGEIIAFTDDDVTVRPNWIARLRQGFLDPQTIAVTGLVLPRQLETESQLIFEKEFGGFHQGYQTRVFDPQFFKEMQHRGVPVWKIGAGANMALRRRAFELVGDFDDRLGAGRAGCSEDSELWYRILAQGGSCRYEPSAVVYHDHRDDLTKLNHQMYHYMRGHVAALLIQFERYQHWGNLRRLFAALPKYYIKRAASQLLGKRKPLSRTLWIEIWGCLAGVGYYLQNRQPAALSVNSAELHQLSNPQVSHRSETP